MDIEGINFYGHQIQRELKTTQKALTQLDQETDYLVNCGESTKEDFLIRVEVALETLQDSIGRYARTLETVKKKVRTHTE